MSTAAAAFLVSCIGLNGLIWFGILLCAGFRPHLALIAAACLAALAIPGIGIFMNPSRRNQS